MNPSSDRGFRYCRCCGADRLKLVLSLGAQPLPSEYGKKSSDVMESFPLDLRVCELCGLGQLAEYVLPERIFHSSYPYISSASSTWVRLARDYARDFTDLLDLGRDSLVLEVASNDGYLLREFKNLGVPVLGIEPAANVAGIARGLGVDTIINFFGENLARELLDAGKTPTLIVANNVFAHVPDMQDFMSGLSLLCGAQTTITIENPAFTTLLRDTLFDTVYHEHYSYLSAHSVEKIARLNGLNLLKVEKLPTHGGSYRYWLGRGRGIDSSVAKTLKEESDFGLFDSNVWGDFAERTRSTIHAAREWLGDRQRNGDVVVGYGAAHKGNTFLNSIGEMSRIIRYVVDASPEKHGRFLPGSQIPVLSPDQLDFCNPTDVLILPWNLADEISENVRRLSPRARVWVAQPQLRQLVF